jgi:hypothetical protein
MAKRKSGISPDWVTSADPVVRPEAVSFGSGHGCAALRAAGIVHDNAILN